jgi:hypothetical protein
MDGATGHRRWSPPQGPKEDDAIGVLQIRNVANLLGLALLVSFASVLRRAQRCGASGA